MSNERILIVDDAPELADILSDYLNAEGFVTQVASDGRQALERFRSFDPQLVILDIMLPELDGMEICRVIRSASDIPILLLSAKNNDIDKIVGLGVGADDYITKPFSPGEVVARVKAQLRRAGMAGRATDAGLSRNRLDFGRLCLDLGEHTVTVDRQQVELPAKAFALLSFLARNPRQVFSREQLFERIWGFDEYGDINTVTVHISKIREKIETDPAAPRFVQTVWGVGYKFDPGTESTGDR